MYVSNSATVVKVTVGERELLTSGTVHIEGDHPIAISIANLKFIFNFKDDDGTARYTGTVVDGVVSFDLFNHNNSLGEGKLTPIEIAKLSDRPLSFTYLVNTVSSETKARSFEYAFYLGSKS
jgi:hypothetical protein